MTYVLVDVDRLHALENATERFMQTEAGQYLPRADREALERDTPTIDIHALLDRLIAEEDAKLEVARIIIETLEQ